MLANVSPEPPPRALCVGNKRKNVAGTTGLEPATSDVTGRRSNQLNYVPAFCQPDYRITQPPIPLHFVTETQPSKE